VAIKIEADILLRGLFTLHAFIIVSQVQK